MVSNFIAGSVNAEQRAQHGVDASLSKPKVAISSESLRFLTYVCFWMFNLFAMAMNHFFSIPYLKKGPQLDDGSYEDKDQCGAFKDTPMFERRFGFDQKTESHLEEFFGLANICTNWDYYPSRELTAMIFPIFEYSIVAYIIFNYIQCKIQHRRGELSDAYMRAMHILTPIQIVLCIWFRLIFVFIAYEEPRGHTFGFLCLQVGLIIMNIMNPIYVLETKQNYSFLNWLGCGRFNGTRVFAWTNMIVTFLVALVKLYATAYIVFNLSGDKDILYPPLLVNKMFLTKNYGWWVDQAFMIFVAIVPLITSFSRWKHEPAMTFEIDLLNVKEIETGVVGEQTPLVV